MKKSHADFVSHSVSLKSQLDAHVSKSIKAAHVGLDWFKQTNKKIWRWVLKEGKVKLGIISIRGCI